MSKLVAVRSLSIAEITTKMLRWFFENSVLPSTIGRSNGDGVWSNEKAFRRLGTLLQGAPTSQEVALRVRSAVLPTGWQKKLYSTYVALLDKKGRCRATVGLEHWSCHGIWSGHFVLYPCCRFGYQAVRGMGEGGHFEITDCGKVIKRFRYSRRQPLVSVLCNKVDKWFDKHYPRYQDPTAYWGRERVRSSVSS